MCSIVYIKCKFIELLQYYCSINHIYMYYFSNSLTELFQSYLQSGQSYLPPGATFPDTPLSTGESGGPGHMTNHPMSSLASLLLNAGPDAGNMDQSTAGADVNPPSSGANIVGAGSGGGGGGTDSGVITPEEMSNITSSDAATVHSSTSGGFWFWYLW